MNPIIKETTAVSFAIARLRDSVLKEIMFQYLGRVPNKEDYKLFNMIQDPNHPNQQFFGTGDIILGEVEMYLRLDGKLWNVAIEFTPLI